MNAATLLISTSAIIFTAAAIVNRSRQQIGDEYSDADSFTAALAGELAAPGSNLYRADTGGGVVGERSGAAVTHQGMSLTHSDGGF